MKPWSISTTVRNPERIRDFLGVLKHLEGKPFNTDNQEKYQILLIQNKFYKPLNIPIKFQKYYDNPELEIPFKIASEIFYHQDYEDPAMRGRQSVNPLNKLGFSIAREREGNIIITELGNHYISGEYDIGYIFFKSLLKLQFPNPWSSDFSTKDGFDVQPLISTMHLINNVNKKSDKKGLTQIEFCLFVPTLINNNLIDYYVEMIFKYRKERNKDKFIKDFAKEFYQTNNLIDKQIKNFYEYGDNIMRYFRLTKYFKVATDKFGSDWRIDFEPSRKLEIELILNKFNGQSLKFKNKDEFLNYISDITLPKLPSEDLVNLKAIAHSLVINILKFAKDNNVLLSNHEKNIIESRIDDASKKEVEELISNVRKINLALIERQNKSYLLYNVDKLKSIISDLKNSKILKKYAPEQFEKIIAEALKIINDEIRIQPNYPVDDQGEPIDHASGGKPDIECYYNSYNAICEVTLDSSRNQWMRESQPVMRHLWEFEKSSSNTLNYCLFIAPKIHIDTVFYFWTSIKHGYASPSDNIITQKIVPISSEQFAMILETCLKLIEKGKRFSHNEIGELYNGVISLKDSVNSHTEWYKNIPQIIEEWKRKIVA
ncbi:MAG: hypothetical protein A2X61_03100 [Ignavibacteria bacterium GWB2_35_12]|nr:MAG: hypothetical protein A2X63_11445 [Ignavibacteria bacterium GWA2_35_8]OGU38279.1 MAG: hypothetical protein A2X61_03100 [Ignavibacteria bacterium GWB2_35_12]OGU95500.1 MAG: hypothetical protein A2220_07275 [Ignavibacteria bacterium RIFOXYA2_FULL_35_10]OGV20783.1 MAG: hypothetical protein A2475_11445 [Ignavibacteria bacterium RIFOXYC2_FULL_35_21]